MAPKPEVSNEAFLYTCLQNVNGKTVDFNAVSAILNCSGPAARMRFTRLKAKIETSNPTMVSTRKASVTKTSALPKAANSKRKSSVMNMCSFAVPGDDLSTHEDFDPNDGDYPVRKRRTRAKQQIDLTAAFESDTDYEVRQHEDSSDDYDAAENGDEEEDEDADPLTDDEEIKIARRRKSKTTKKFPTTPKKSAPTTEATAKKAAISTPRSIVTTSTIRSIMPVMPESNGRSETILPGIEKSPFPAQPTPPQTGTPRNRFATPGILQLTPSEIADDLAMYNVGPMLPLSHKYYRYRSAAQSPILGASYLPADTVMPDVTDQDGTSSYATAIDNNDQDDASIALDESVSSVGSDKSHSRGTTPLLSILKLPAAAVADDNFE